MLDDSKLLVERVQTGVRMEKRLLKVLKAFAEYHDMTLGDVLEGIVLHAFDGKTPFSAASLERIRELKKIYELDLDSSASHRLREIKAKSPGTRRAGGTKSEHKEQAQVKESLFHERKMRSDRAAMDPGYCDSDRGCDVRVASS